MTGTWRLEFVLGDGSCGDMPNMSLDLALAPGPANTVTGAARIVGASPESAVLPALRVAPYNEPGIRCGVRVRWAQPSGEHAELLLARETDGVRGGGSLWSTHEGAACRQSGSVFAEYTAARPESWSRLTAAGPWPELAAPKRASAELDAAARTITAKSMFRGARKPRVALRGSVVDYVAAVVDDARAIQLFTVGCTTVAGAQCVAIVGDPCRPGKHEGEDCEGMYLTVVVDTARSKLDRAASSIYPVETQTDIEERLEMAP